MCSGFEAGSYFRRIDFVYHSTLGLRVITKKKTPSTRLTDVTRSTGVLGAQVADSQVDAWALGQCDQEPVEFGRPSQEHRRRCAPIRNNYFKEMCSGSEAGSYLRLIDHSTLGLRVIKKRNLSLERAGALAGAPAKFRPASRSKPPTFNAHSVVFTPELGQSRRVGGGARRREAREVRDPPLERHAMPHRAPHPPDRH